MIDLQKLTVKFYMGQPSEVPLRDFIGVFQGWIQSADGIYHDVADYSHMKSGPGIVLIANDANVSIDESGDRRGLLFSRKSSLIGSNQEKLRVVFQAALENCRKLEQEPALSGKLRFATNEALMSVNDRLWATNTSDAFEEIRRDVEPFAKRIFGDVVLDRDGDPRQRLNVCLKTSTPMNLGSLLNNLQPN